MITITNNNIFKSEYSITDYISYDDIDVIDDGEILANITDIIELGESLKFERIFDIISANVEMFELVFYSSLGGCPLLPYLREIIDEPTIKNKLNFLEVCWSADKFDNEITIKPDFHGVKNNESYALDFTPLNNIKTTLIKLNSEVSIIDIENKKIDFLGFQNFTVFDFFHAIFNEISFNGLPEDRDIRSIELDKSFSELDEDDFKAMDDEKKEFDKMTITEFIDHMDSKDEYLVKYKKLKERIEPNLAHKKNITALKGCMIEKLKIYNDIINSNKKTDLTPFYKKLTHIEYSLQSLYGDAEDIKFHKFWQTPKCTCPKIDNIEIYPSKNPIFDKKCPIHKKIIIKKTKP